MGFREPEQFATVRGEGDYEGLEARVRLRPISLDFQISIQRRMASEDTDQIEAAIRDFGDAVLLDWNVEDKDGNPLPATGEGILRGSMTLLIKLVEGWAGAINNPPLVSSSSSNGSLSIPSASAGDARRRRS